MRPRAFVASGLMGLLMLFSAGCGSDEADIRVYAASSLTEVVEELTLVFEEKNEGVEVSVSFAGSSTLAAQIIEGAPASLMLSASPQQIDVLEEEGLAEQRFGFAKGRLVVAANRDSGVEDFWDLAEEGVLLVLAAEDVPAGEYARQILAGAGGAFAEAALGNVASDETSVRAALAKVRLGEADATIVYATDMTDEALKDVVAIAVPREVNVETTWEGAVIRGAPKTTEDFLDFLAGRDGRAILEDHGFELP